MEAGLTRIVVRYGFAESPDVPLALGPIGERDPSFDPARAAYFLSRQALIPTRADR